MFTGNLQSKDYIYVLPFKEQFSAKLNRIKQSCHWLGIWLCCPHDPEHLHITVYCEVKLNEVTASPLS